MHWIRFGILILATMILQASLGDVIAVTSRGVRPDLLLVLMVYFAVNGLPTDAVIASFVIGLGNDLIGWTLGPQMLSFGICGTVLSRIRQYIVIRKVPYQGMVILAAGAITSALTRILARVKGVPVPDPPLDHLLWGPLYSAIIGPVIFIALEWLMRLQDKRYRLGMR
jgi:rod shape-determining protein MreD